MSERLAKLEEAVVSIKDAVLQLSQKSQPPQPQPGAKSKATPALRPPDKNTKAAEDGLPGLDPAVVRSALQAGIGRDQLQSLSQFLGGKKPAVGDVAASRGRTPKVRFNELGEVDEEDAEGPTAEPALGAPADAMQAALLKLTTIAEGLTKSRKKLSLEDWSDDLPALQDSSSSSSCVGGSSRKHAAVLASLRKALKENPSELYRVMESRMLDDFGSAGTGPGEPSRPGTFRGWAEHRSRIPNISGTVRLIWAVCGALDSLRAGRVPEAQARFPMNNIFQLAAHGCNETINATGFSPFQWVRGGADRDQPLPGLDPKKMFEGLLHLKEKAKAGYELESAKQRLSKLNNSVGRAPQVFKPGDLLMLWRQKNRPGRVTGAWVGPIRLLLQEGGTLLATGSTLIRARTNQVRACSKNEELSAMLEGAAVLSTPTTVDALMKHFTGKHYVNATGEVPSEQQRQANLQGAEVALAPGSDFRPDSWKIEVEGRERWLVRQHNMPRLTLFIPSRTQACPIDEAKLTGKRVTKVKAMTTGAQEVVIEDDYKTDNAPQRQLQERWRGQTRFQIEEDVKRPKITPKEKSDRKRQTMSTSSAPATSSQQQPVSQPEHDVQPPPVPNESGDEEALRSDGAPAGEIAGQLLPEVPEINPLTTALRDRGASVVDGVPTMRRDDQNQCAVPECAHPGGHDGPHIDAEEKKFSWEPYSGRVNAQMSDGESSSTSSDESDELIPDGPEHKKPKKEKKSDPFYVLEIPMEEEDIQYLAEKPRRATAWMSKKLESRSKELRWSQMPIEQKYLFDEAQSKELSQVLTSKAVRSLSRQKEMNIDHSKIMSMRWVMTVKAGGDAKARLVVLGYQQHNLTSVQSSAPTMSRVARNLVLTICACLHFWIASGDVSSAFLQASQSLEGEDLYVWAPAELAVLFGASPDRPIKVLKICRAFYGLVHAPRKWFDHVVSTLKSQGWQQLLSDQCTFILVDNGRIVGACGIHVDDFLIGGDRTSEKFLKAEKNLQQAYRWGKVHFLLLDAI